MSTRVYRVPLGMKDALFIGEMEPTIGDLYNFVLLNKGTKTFIGYSNERVFQMLMEGIQDQSLYYETGLDGKIQGMILAIIDHDRKLVFVSENLAMCLQTLKNFATKCRMTYPGYTIEAYRHGKPRIFNTEKLYNKLT